MEFSLDTVDHLFPTPLFRFKVEEADRLNARLLAEIERRREQEGGTKRSNQGGWHSANDFFDRREPAHADLAKLVMRMMAQATRQVAPDADLAKAQLMFDGWINVNPRGAYNAPHNHTGAFWSGTYYVQVPDGVDKGGMIEFLSPSPALPGAGVIDGPLTANGMCVRPVPGMVLLFPARLSHWVHPNDSDELRVTIAFNGRFRPKPAAPAPAVNRRPAAVRPRS